MLNLVLKHSYNLFTQCIATRKHIPFYNIIILHDYSYFLLSLFFVFTGDPDHTTDLHEPLLPLVSCLQSEDSSRHAIPYPEDNLYSIEPGQGHRPSSIFNTETHDICFLKAKMAFKNPELHNLDLADISI